MENYRETLREVAQKKEASLPHSKQDANARNALFRFLQQRGFEAELIREVLKN